MPSTSLALICGDGKRFSRMLIIHPPTGIIPIIRVVAAKMLKNVRATRLQRVNKNTTPIRNPTNKRLMGLTNAQRNLESQKNMEYYNHSAVCGSLLMTKSAKY
jgi:hypothetical protein